MAQKWDSETPEYFRFSLKFPQTITHENELEYEKSKDELTRFFSGLEPLKSKISVLALQLPPSLWFEKAKPRLEELSKHLAHYCRYAVEGRHESWFSGEAIKFLSEKKFSLVWSEVPMVKNPAPLTTDFVYIRLIGDRALPDDVYNHTVRDQGKVIESWARKLKGLEKEDNVKSAYAVLNNHLEGFAPSSANTLRAKVGKEELSFADKKQKTLF